MVPFSTVKILALQQNYDNLSFVPDRLNRTYNSSKIVSNTVRNLSNILAYVRLAFFRHNRVCMTAFIKREID